MMFLESDNIIGKCLDAYGESHFHEVELLRQLVKPGDVVIDAGANIGVITVPLAQAVGKEGYVVALEAQPFIYNILCGNLALNNLQNVQPFNRAVAERSGKLAFMPEIDYTEDLNYGGVLLASVFNTKDSAGRASSRPIPTITIDDLNLAKPSFIKIDVEGMEVMTLAGGINTIRRAKPIMYIEFIAGREEILIALRDLGYQWKLHEPPFFNEDNFLKHKQDVLANEQGIGMISSDLLCWHPDNPAKAESPYFVDFEKGLHPRHRAILKIRDKVYGTGTT